MNNQEDSEKSDQRWRSIRLWLLRLSYQVLAGSSATWALTQKELGSLAFFEILGLAGFLAGLAELANQEQKAQKNR